MMTATIAMLLTAMIEVESAGNDSAVGDDGRAFGCLQIHKCVLADINRAYGAEYILRDCYDRETSCLIARQYLAIYARKYAADHKTTASMEVLARIWNGGPRGWENPETENYWQRVKTVIERLQS